MCCTHVTSQSHFPQIFDKERKTATVQCPQLNSVLQNDCLLVDYLLKIIDYYYHLIDGAQVIDVRGMSYLPFFNKWCWIEDTSVNFALRAIKPDRSPEVTTDTQTNTET